LRHHDGGDKLRLAKGLTRSMADSATADEPVAELPWLSILDPGGM
jgi:hypothetical protein